MTCRRVLQAASRFITQWGRTRCVRARQPFALIPIAVSLIVLGRAPCVGADDAPSPGEVDRLSQISGLTRGNRRSLQHLRCYRRRFKAITNA